jgi:hypothetical protein
MTSELPRHIRRENSARARAFNSPKIRRSRGWNLPVPPAGTNKYWKDVGIGWATNIGKRIRSGRCLWLDWMVSGLSGLSLGTRAGKPAGEKSMVFEDGPFGKPSGLNRLRGIESDYLIWSRLRVDYRPSQK